MSSLKNQAIWGIIWGTIERFSLQGVNFVLGLVLARLLNPSDFGLYGMLSVFISLSQIFIDGGLSSALIQRKDRTESDFSTVFYVNLGVSLLFYFLLYACAPLISNFYNQPELLDMTRIVSLTLIINSMASVSKVKLTIKIDFKTLSKITLSSAILSGLLGVFFAYLGYGVWALVIQTLVSSVANVILSFYFVRWLPKTRFSKNSFNKLFFFSSKLLLSSLISTLYVNIYTLVIGKKFSSEALGLYTRAEQFTSFAGSSITSILHRVSYPLFSKIQDDNDRLIDAYRRYIQMSSFLVFPLIMGLCGIAKPLIILILTEKWLPCVLLLQVLCFSYLWECIIMVNLNLLYVKGRSDLVLKLEVVKKNIAISILFISIPFGLLGVCVGRALYAIIAMFLNTYYTKKILNYGLLEQTRDFIHPLFLSFIIAFEGIVISFWMKSSLVAVITSMIVCPLTYVSCSKLFKFKQYKEIISIVNNRKW